METITVNDSTLINDLIQINNDRIAGYQKAIEIATRLDLENLNSIFVEYMNQSELFIEELKPYLEQQGSPATDGTMISGKLFRIWMDIKSAISGNDEKSLLASCEQGEDAFKKTYKDVVDNEGWEITHDLLLLVEKQLAIQLEAHEYIKTLRDNAQ
ncbi:PA2169 family four-helix-bundle protein [Sphingobacterium sp. N143]|uniref:ferritin-like domain-containing protein n=1 Tax=Sphingobacterium sp. N143 TaxID=2746727 RepID=UPI0025750216|nr:PA2169 family four-helix-bundle protein [Sphingobacterium sp. N143]MDM1293282.1 PA2169 family four-helix-bundle protein [Sphingobacterium sp. N143]